MTLADGAEILSLQMLICLLADTTNWAVSETDYILCLHESAELSLHAGRIEFYLVDHRLYFSITEQVSKKLQIEV